MYENICSAIHRELEYLDEKYADEKIRINGQDLENFDTMVHALKSIATYEAMKSAGREYDRTRSKGGRYENYHGYPEYSDRRY